MDNKQILSIYTDSEPGEVCTSGRLRFMVGDRELTGVERVSFGRDGSFETDDVVVVTITCAARFGR